MWPAGLSMELRTSYTEYGAQYPLSPDDEACTRPRLCVPRSSRRPRMAAVHESRVGAAADYMSCWDSRLQRPLHLLSLSLSHTHSLTHSLSLPLSVPYRKFPYRASSLLCCISGARQSMHETLSSHTVQAARLIASTFQNQSPCKQQPDRHAALVITSTWPTRRLARSYQDRRSDCFGPHGTPPRCTAHGPCRAAPCCRPKPAAPALMPTGCKAGTAHGLQGCVGDMKDIVKHESRAAHLRATLRCAPSSQGRTAALR